MEHELTSNDMDIPQPPTATDLFCQVCNKCYYMKPNQIRTDESTGVKHHSTLFLYANQTLEIRADVKL